MTYGRKIMWPREKWGGTSKKVSASTSSSITYDGNTLTQITSVSLSKGLWLIVGTSELATTSGQNDGNHQLLLRYQTQNIQTAQVAFIHDIKFNVVGVYEVTDASRTITLYAYSATQSLARGGSIVAVKIGE